MIFESENYSPLERVDESLRRRVLDEMSQWESTAPAMSRSVGGCGCSDKRGQDQRRSRETSPCGVPACGASSRGASTCGSSGTGRSSGTDRASGTAGRCGCGCGRSRATDNTRDTEMSCTAGCTNDSPSLAMVYSPNQQWRCLYCVCEGLDRGTIFRELDFPFYPTPCRKGGRML